MGFVGTLIGTESHIAIDTVGAILGREARDRAVEPTDLMDERIHKGIELRLQGSIACLVGHEPLAIIVGLQLAKEGDNLFHCVKPLSFFYVRPHRYLLR